MHFVTIIYKIYINIRGGVELYFYNTPQIGQTNLYCIIKNSDLYKVKMTNLGHRVWKTFMITL